MIRGDEIREAAAKNRTEFADLFDLLIDLNNFCLGVRKYSRPVLFQYSQDIPYCAATSVMDRLPSHRFITP
jgi:hypothetical protein